MGSPMKEFGKICYIGVTIAPYCSGSNSETSSLNSGGDKHPFWLASVRISRVLNKTCQIIYPLWRLLVNERAAESSFLHRCNHFHHSNYGRVQTGST